MVSCASVPQPKELGGHSPVGCYEWTITPPRTIYAFPSRIRLLRNTRVSSNSALNGYAGSIQPALRDSFPGHLLWRSINDSLAIRYEYFFYTGEIRVAERGGRLEGVGKASSDVAGWPTVAVSGRRIPCW